MKKILGWGILILLISIPLIFISYDLYLRGGIIIGLSFAPSCVLLVWVIVFAGKLIDE